MLLKDDIITSMYMQEGGKFWQKTLYVTDDNETKTSRRLRHEDSRHNKS
jgi:hypothetical protein